MNRLRIICGGGFGSEVLLYVQQVAASTIVCEPESIHSSAELNIREGDEFVIACGDPVHRRRVSGWLAERGARLRSVIHPLAFVAPTARIGAGAVVCPFAFVGPNAEVGENVVLNVHSSCGHDAVIGGNCVFSPYSFVAGSAVVGEGVLLGSYAFVAQGVKVGRRSKLAVGAIAMHEVGEFSLAVGNPAKSRQIFSEATN